MPQLLLAGPGEAGCLIRFSNMAASYTQTTKRRFHDSSTKKPILHCYAVLCNSCPVCTYHIHWGNVHVYICTSVVQLAIIFSRMPENWRLLYFGETRATLVDYTMTRELNTFNTLLAAAVLTSSVFRDMKFLRMPTDLQNSRKLHNANISAHTCNSCPVCTTFTGGNLHLYIHQLYGTLAP